MKPNETGRYTEEFKYISLCGRVDTNFSSSKIKNSGKSNFVEKWSTLHQKSLLTLGFFISMLILGPAKIFLKNTFLYLYVFKELVYERSRNSCLSSITENVLTDRKQFLTFFTIFYVSEMLKMKVTTDYSDVLCMDYIKVF